MPIELWKIFPNVGKPQGNSFFSTIKNRSFLYLNGYKKRPEFDHLEKQVQVTQYPVREAVFPDLLQWWSRRRNFQTFFKLPSFTIRWYVAALGIMKSIRLIYLVNSFE